MSVDPVFRNVAGNMTGFHVWRIENMQVVPIPSEAWGKFFTGDAYIVLSSAPHGSRYHDCLGKLISHDNVFQFIHTIVSGGVSVKSSLHNGRVEQHIHFWLGEEASTDEVMKTSVDLSMFMWD